MSGSDTDEMRAELAAVAASLRAYLEWQTETGATGIPRKPRSRTAARPRVEVPVGEPQIAPEVVAPERGMEVASRSLELEEPTPTHRPFEIEERPAPARVERRPADAPPVVPARASARPLEVVAEEVQDCTRCELGSARTSAVFARGTAGAKVCFVGDAPSPDDDLAGRPFAGPAGQLLDKMIAAMGLDPQNDVYVCTIVKCAPPEGREPTTEEIERCLPYLHEQLEGAAPSVIVALGNASLAALLGTKPKGAKRGAWKLYGGKIPVMPTHHPAMLLRPGPGQAEAKKQAWEDLQAVMKQLGLPIKKP